MGASLPFPAGSEPVRIGLSLHSGREMTIQGGRLDHTHPQQRKQRKQPSSQFKAGTNFKGENVPPSLSSNLSADSQPLLPSEKLRECCLPFQKLGNTTLLSLLVLFGKNWSIAYRRSWRAKRNLLEVGYSMWAIVWRPALGSPV